MVASGRRFELTPPTNSQFHSPDLPLFRRFTYMVILYNAVYEIECSVNTIDGCAGRIGRPIINNTAVRDRRIAGHTEDSTGELVEAVCQDKSL